MTDRVRLGELLVETGLIKKEQLERALALQKEDPRRLGEIVVGEGMVSEAKVTQVLSQQLSVPWVSLEYVDFSRQLLNLVSSETAQKHTLVPIYVRRSKQRRETLYVAIEDPSNEEALDEVADFAGLPVRPMIAPPSDIRAAIRAYYLGLPPESAAPDVPQALMEVQAKGTSRPPLPPPSRRANLQEMASAATNDAEAPPPPQDLVASAPVDELSQMPDPTESQDTTSEDEDEVPDSVELKPRDSRMPEPANRSKHAPKMITLTMLDGTQVRLPAAGKRRSPEQATGGLTARDLVEALRAEAGGKDVSQVLGEEVNWQKMFAALLSLMLKKHLILDWEFVRELKR